MNRNITTQSGPPWQQVIIEFEDYSAAEHTAVTHLGPVMTNAETAGLIESWFFIRKSPSWRMRFLPTHPATAKDAASFIHQRLDTLHGAGRIARWVETIYEPEERAFGGTSAMELAHHLFHSDSQQILAYLADGCGGHADQRRELSILLCSILMRSAGQDWYEQGDIWARIAQDRPAPSDIPPERLRGMEPNLRKLMTVDAGPTSTLVHGNGPLTFLADWAGAFADVGARLGEHARTGTLGRGLRAVLAHHVLFHWNRLGLAYTTQSILARVAKATVLDQ